MKALPAWADFWTAYAALYDRCWDSALTADVAAEVWNAADPDLPFLEIGAGTGLVTAEVVRRGGRYVGVSDPSQAMLGRLRTRLPEVHAVVGTVPTATAHGGPRNVVIANVLHLVAPHDRAEILMQARRLAGPGGRVIATAPTPGTSLTSLLRAFRRSGDGWGHVVTFCLAHLLIAPLATVAQVSVTPVDLTDDLGLAGVAIVHGVQQVATGAGGIPGASDRSSQA